MAINLNILSIPLNGTGTEIPTLNVTDPFEKYVLTGTATATGNYAIVPTGTPQQGTTFIFKYKAVLDITTNSKTFSIFGQALTQNQLTSDLDIEAYYDTAAWIVEVKPSFTSAVVEAANLTANAVTASAIANGSIDLGVKGTALSLITNRIADLAVTTAKINTLAVTDAKINDVNGSKLVDDTVTNAKLSNMADQTIKGNISGGSANPSDISINTLLNSNSWLLLGNSGTTPGTNFIGTTDNQDLVFKRNNIDFGRLANGSVSLGNQALSNNLGTSNTAIGYQALINNSNSSQNTALGATSLESNITGQYNTAVGGASGSTNESGDSNTFLGFGANTSAINGTKRIAIGYSANATSDNQFAIPDDVTTIKFRGLVYNLPTSQAAGVLTNDGSGNLTWV